MLKRKRPVQVKLHDKLDKHYQEVFQALKAAKGLERQRLGKRVRDGAITAEKKERLDREIVVLKSLDLNQTAKAHLHSSLLKIKDIAAHENLPENIRAGVGKPQLPAEERVALHNVTSGLYNTEQVKKAIDRAVATVCVALNVALPEKAKRSNKTKEAKRQTSSATETELSVKPGKRSAPEETEKNMADEVTGNDEEESESEWEGIQSDVDDADEAVGEQDSEVDAEEEKELAKYAHLLGSSSDEEEDFDDDRYSRFRGKEKANLDDISLSGSGSEAEIASDSDDDEEEEAPAKRASPSPSPPPAKKKKAMAGRPTGSTFLPSLMGGYISGSESEASDIDVAPAKKRRGQRARQAIWEKKFGTMAKHLHEPAKGQRGRGSGWDMKRGAVDGKGGGTPWKKGIRNPLASGGASRGQDSGPPARAPGKRDDEGTLHPSWAAKKKAQEAAKDASFAGTKVVFD